MTSDDEVVLGHHDDTGTTGQRRGAGLYDVLVLGWAVGSLAVPVGAVAPVLAEGSLFWLWLLTVVVEGTTGASPGKHVTGLEVRRLDGDAVGLVTAARRRPWGWLLPLQFVGPVPNALATTVALATVLAMLVSVERSDDRRGFHDRWAATVVVDGEFDRRARLVVVGLTAVAGILGFVLAAGLATSGPV
jgi:uncharacterized RDD family membrane protein YckC